MCIYIYTYIYDKRSIKSWKEKAKTTIVHKFNLRRWKKTYYPAYEKKSHVTMYAYIVHMYVFMYACMIIFLY